MEPKEENKIENDQLENDETNEEETDYETFRVEEDETELFLYENEGQIEVDEQESEESVVVKKKRCQRKKKSKRICLDDGEEETEDDQVLDETESVEEDESSSSSSSVGTSILSAISFEWDDKRFEFDELCDPGVIENIYRSYNVQPDVIDEIGIKRYEYLCNVLKVPPVQRIIRSLETDEIDLSFRGLDGKNLRAMFMALETNTFVRKVILKYNKLSKDDCFYLGRTLNVNETIAVLDLTGCSLGSDGMDYLVEYLTTNETLVELNLSKCYLEDDGINSLARILLRNNSIEKLNLSYNKLREGAANALAVALKVNTAVSDLNLCYNNFFDPLSLRNFFRSLMGNKAVETLNVAWNAISGIDAGIFISNFLRRNRSVKSVDLSDNRLDGSAISELKKGLSRSRIKILKLSRNPLSPDDLDALLIGVKSCASLTTLDLEDLWVKKSFIKILNKIRLERSLDVNLGGVYSDYEILGADFAAILFKRAVFEANKPKSQKARKDFGHLIWTLGEDPLSEEEFMAKVKKFRAKVKKELIRQIMNHFFLPKLKLVDVAAMKKKYLSVFPESTPPPLPKTKEKLEWAEEETETETEEVEEGAQGIVTAVTAYSVEQEASKAPSKEGAMEPKHSQENVNKKDSDQKTPPA